MFLINLNDFISNLESRPTKYIENMIKIFNCTILESNSGPLDHESDALPVELSMPLTFLFITLKIVAISKCLSDNQGKF